MAPKRTQGQPGPFETESFLALKKEWEAKLKAEGLGEVLPNANPYRSGMYHGEAVQWTAKRDYFAQLGKRVADEKFPTQMERITMEMAAEGKSLVETLIELERHGMPSRERQLRTLIRSYEVKWGIRRWTKAKAKAEAK